GTRPWPTRSPRTPTTRSRSTSTSPDDVRSPPHGTVGVVGQVFGAIDDRLREFLAAQPVFFVATAPGSGHVNVSPKGYADTFVVLGSRTVAYLDLTGSGVETVAHVRENGRVTLMFCAFGGPPRIVRLYGT